MRHVFCVVAVAALVAPAPALAASDSDQQVANKIAQNLKQTDGLKGYEINVKYRSGAARLEGWVRDEAQLKIALDTVNRTPQVQNVINKLSVKQGAAGQQTAAPTATIQRAANNEPQSQKPIVRRAAGSSPSRNTAQPPAPQQAQQAYARPQAYPQQQQQQQRQMAAMPRQPQGPRAYPQQYPQQYRQPYPYAQPYGQAPRGYAPQGVVPAGAMRRVSQGPPVPEYVPGTGGGAAPALYDQPNLPNYAWPTYAAYPNYGALTYPKQYSPTAWPYIGPFYPYPQVPLGWRKVTLEWDDGWWFLDFSDDRRHCCGR